MTSTDTIESLRAERDQLLKDIGYLLYTTPGGNHLRATITTKDGKYTSESVQQAKQALVQFNSNVKGMSSRLEEDRTKLRQMEDDVAGMRRIFGLPDQKEN